jgi:outer membrane protein assembly factor BamB
MKMKIQKKQLQAAITIALTLTIAATLITVLPVTFSVSGQLTAPQIVTEAVAVAYPFTNGINQNELIWGVVTPRPDGYDHDPTLSKHNIYRNMTFMIHRPDGTVENRTMDSDDRAEAWFWYNCTQLGHYYVQLSWPGDADHKPSVYLSLFPGVEWVVQADPTPGVVPKTPNIYVATTPNKVGTGDSIYIAGWCTPTILYRAVYYDLTFTITKPDGSVIKKVQDSNAEASTSFSIVCDQAGNWSVVLSFAGNLVRNAATTAPTKWTVEDGYVAPTIPQEPLPTGPWTWPISAEYYEWYQISGPWPLATYDASSANFNPYSNAPRTAHIIWRKQMDKAGIMGGDTGYYDWSPSFPNMVAAQGRLYYTKAETVSGGGGTSTATHPVLYCLDEFTGELIYRRDLPGSGSGGSPVLEIFQRAKGEPTAEALPTPLFSLWLTSGGVWQIDPFTGQTTYYNSALSGTYHDGAIYMNNYPKTGNLTKWDTASRSIVWTVQSPWIPGGMTENYPFPELFWQDIGYGRKSYGGTSDVDTAWSWNLTTGQLIMGPAQMPVRSPMSRSHVIGDGNAYWVEGDMRVYAQSLTTGKISWISDPMEYPWGVFGCYIGSHSWGPTGGNGQVYIPTYDGHLYAYDTLTGKKNWAAFTDYSLGETANNVYTPWSQPIIADSKVYYTVSEHTAPQPLPRGGKLYCVDANTGERIWALDGFYSGSTSGGGISSGILWYPNRYDGCTYAFGKGQTATTVSAPMTTIPLGSSLLIQGTVTDQSPGAKDTPAVSDESMSQWMGYLYMNKPMPTNVTGVTVHLMAALSNGTVIDITHVTTDIMGHYEYTWTPPAQDTYKILANFEGSDSYYTSSAQTGLSVGAAPAATTAPQAAPDTTMTIIGTGIGTGIAIIIAVAVAVLMLKKRP